MDMKKPYLSVIVPLFNEEHHIALLYNKLKEVISRSGIIYELIFIDDGSIDKTFDLVMELHKKDKDVRVIRFSKNFGQTLALSAGFDSANGEVIIAMDGDMQHDPEDIPLFLSKIEEGYDVVSGWRENRVDAFWSRRLPSMVANKIISWISGVKLHDFGTTFKAYKSHTIKNLDLFSELHRFIPALVSVQGISMTEVPIKNTARKHGKSKYNLFRVFKVLLDFVVVKYLISFINSPLKIFGSLGLFMSMAGIFIDIILIGLFLLGKIANVRDHGGLLLLSVLLVVVGVQFITVAVIAEISAKIYHEVKGRKGYAIKFRTD
ncbi:MAG: glycosyltransferase family 2 protein [Candidatus Gorgyraea atricola]|nr:glycosyltransferase family 2 protein [Candidatus Gorgyraea atricola]